jgi:hypothetical protein
VGLGQSSSTSETSGRRGKARKTRKMRKGAGSAPRARSGSLDEWIHGDGRSIIDGDITIACGVESGMEFAQERAYKPLKQWLLTGG